jgi:hypothetical protein
MPDATWIELAGGAARSDLQSWQRGNRLTDVDIGVGPWSSAPFSAILTDFTGGAADQDRGELIVGNAGGHASRQGNDVYACRLRSDSPGWVRLSNPSSNVGTNGAVPSSLSDNTPKAPHGWWRAVYANGRVWWPTMDAYYPDNVDVTTWSFNRAGITAAPAAAASGVWARHGKCTNNPNDGSAAKFAGGGSTYDPVGNYIWTIPNYNVYDHGIVRIDASYTGSDLLGSGSARTYPVWTGENLTFGGKWAIVAWDLRVLIAMTSATSTTRPNTICILDLNNPSSGFVYRNPSSGTPDTDFGRGAVYHPASRSVLLWGKGFGANPVKLSIPAHPLTDPNSAWAWSKVSPAAGSAVVPSDPANSSGSYGKFNIIQDMGDGRSALALVNAVTESVYVFKLPAAGV